MMNTKSNLIILAFFSLLWSSCTTNNNKTVIEITTETGEQITSISEISNFLSVKTETFDINPTKDTIIKCEKGTVIYLPANSFENIDESKTIQLKIKEFYSFSDFIGENLTTTSGNRILETGGMINISATSDNKELFLKKGKEYALGFPKKESKKEMELFYGNKDSIGQINWIPRTEVDNNKQDILNNSFESTFECRVGISSYSTESNESYCLTTVVDERNVNIIDYIKQKDYFKYKKNMKKEFCSSEDFRIRVEFRVSSRGTITNIEFDKDNPTHKYDKELSEFLKLFPMIDTSFRHNSSGFKEDLRRKNKYGLTFFGYKQINKNKFEKKYETFKNKAITKIDKDELNYYVMSASKFGWINCDRFWEIDNENKTNFIVKTESANDTQIRIVFKDIKSIMNGNYDNGRYVFNNVPLNKEIKVIGISYLNGKPTMSVSETTISNEDFELSTFKDFTLDQLKAELNSL